MEWKLFPDAYEEQQKKALTRRIEALEKAHERERSALEKEIAARKARIEQKPFYGCLTGIGVGFLLFVAGLLVVGDLLPAFIPLGAVVGYQLMDRKSKRLLADFSEEALQECIRAQQDAIEAERLRTGEDIARYKNAFDEAVDARIARYEASGITKTLADELGAEYLRMIRGEDRSQRVPVVLVPFSCMVHRMCIVSGRRTISFEKENIQVLPGLPDQAALARALAGKLMEFVRARLAADPGGTPYDLEAEYRCIGGHADAVITYRAVNAGYVPTREW